MEVEKVYLHLGSVIYHLSIVEIVKDEVNSSP